MHSNVDGNQRELAQSGLCGESGSPGPDFPDLREQSEQAAWAPRAGRAAGPGPPGHGLPGAGAALPRQLRPRGGVGKRPGWKWLGKQGDLVSSRGPPPGGSGIHKESGR